MESESGENGECFWMLRGPLLVRFCFVAWVLFGVFSTFCMTSFGDGTCPQYQETTKIFCCLSARQRKRMRNEVLHGYYFVTDLTNCVQQKIKEIIW